MEPTLEIFSLQIIILGSFNPPVISPFWLNKNLLIGDEDMKSAMEVNSLAITPDISRFETEWFSIQVIKEQFVMNSKGPVTPALKDLVTGIFTLLEHTPLSAIGINSIAHYKIYSVDEFHKIGDVLAPKNIWNSIYPESDSQSVGLHQVTLEINPFKRESEASVGNYKRVTLSRSDKLPHSIYFIFNDHNLITIEKNSMKTASEKLLEIVDSNWDTSQQEAKTLFSSVLHQAINS